MAKALIAMSGGVDSSVAASFMQERGWDCIGVHMRLFSPETESSCPAARDADDARAVAEQLGMEFLALDCRDEFDRRVISRFVDTYERGMTPNPCIDCNRFLKFGLLHEKARELGCDLVVTGHYARIAEEGGRWLLKKGPDPRKDQSYVLYSLTQEELAHTAFPLGEFTKAEIRAFAEERGFVTAKKKESQDICFVPDGDYGAFITGRTGRTCAPGPFVLEDGSVVGTHRGIIHYTVGQRKGLGIAWKHPLYVLRKDPERNEVVLSDNAALFTDRLLADSFNWVAFDRPTEPFVCTAMTRYQAREVPCTVLPREGGEIEIHFDAPVRAVTPGQAVVLYRGDLLLGGGTIRG